jgi:chemotaxis protein methyltransferase CheR
MQLTTAESQFFRELVRRESAIVLEAGKEYLLESRLAALMRTNELGSFSALIAALRRDARGTLTDAVVEAMTTNETSFFRDIHPWESLRLDLIPQLVEDRATARQLVFVCAACSSGQEPYTLAMLLREHFPQIASTWRIRIIATDLSLSMVERTKAGRFSQLEVGRGLPAALLAKYFTRSGMTWQARDDLRSMIEAWPSNLAERGAWQRFGDVDAIFLRNVLIYFSRETKQDILREAHARLRPTGILLLGSSETTVGLDHTFERFQSGKTIYYRRGDTGGAAPALPRPAAAVVANSASPRTPSLAPATSAASSATLRRSPTAATPTRQ